MDKKAKAEEARLRRAFELKGYRVIRERGTGLYYVALYVYDEGMGHDGLRSVLDLDALPDAHRLLSVVNGDVPDVPEPTPEPRAEETPVVIFNRLLECENGPDFLMHAFRTWHAKLTSQGIDPGGLGPVRPEHNTAG